MKLLNTLVDGFVTDEKFLTLYFAMRRIHDVCGGSSAKKQVRRKRLTIVTQKPQSRGFCSLRKVVPVRV
ncbi:MAG: hypothetical protein LBV41_05325 [Cytophagaceae bacterium]|jgi:hypothetical protein|nr:hypothetical protein [Cytophagaceae bacterium]